MGRFVRRVVRRSIFSNAKNPRVKNLSDKKKKKREQGDGRGCPPPSSFSPPGVCSLSNHTILTYVLARVTLYLADQNT